MRVKIQAIIFPLLALVLSFLASPADLAADGEGGGALSAFSGNGPLREAIWRLAAFVPAGGKGGERSVVVEGVGGLPPVSISLTFGEPLDPWPSGLSLTFLAEDTSPPTLLTLADRRPFGGPNISLSGLDVDGPARKEAENLPRLLTDLLGRLNNRLLAVRPRLGPITWRESAPGFEAARSRLLYGARLGPNDLFLARFDPARFSFRPYHEKEYPDSPQVSIGGWAERLGQAAALINAGQYYPDRAYMGVLKRDGQSLSAGPHPQWKGYLVSEPAEDAPPGAPAAAIIDQQTNREPWEPRHYRNVMQSFMLLDQNGRIRVRDSHNLACRAAIGQDREGRILLIMTPAAVSLYDLAMALKSSSLGLVQVVGLDGGFETQLLLRQDGTPFLSTGQYSITDQRSVYIPGYHPTLPAILSVQSQAIAPDQGIALDPPDADASSPHPFH